MFTGPDYILHAKRGTAGHVAGSAHDRVRFLILRLSYVMQHDRQGGSARPNDELDDDQIMLDDLETDLADDEGLDTQRQSMLDMLNCKYFWALEMAFAPRNL